MLRMRNAISRLRKFSKCAEHIFCERFCETLQFLRVQICEDFLKVLVYVARTVYRGPVKCQRRIQQAADQRWLPSGQTMFLGWVAGREGAREVSSKRSKNNLKVLFFFFISRITAPQTLVLGEALKTKRFGRQYNRPFKNLKVIRSLKYECLLVSVGSWNWLLSSSALTLHDQEAILSANVWMDSSKYWSFFNVVSKPLMCSYQ